MILLSVSAQAFWKRGWVAWLACDKRQIASYCKFKSLSLRSTYRNPYNNGPGTCITYDAINAAYLDARKRIRKLILYLVQ